MKWYLWLETSAQRWHFPINIPRRTVNTLKLKDIRNLLDLKIVLEKLGSCHKRQKPQASTPRMPIRNRQTRKVANAKVLNRNTKLT